MNDKRRRGFWGTLGRLVGRAPREEFWEVRFDALAAYNSEVARGIVHTPEWDQAMSRVQADYNAKMERMCHTPNNVHTRYLS